MIGPRPASAAPPWTRKDLAVLAIVLGTATFLLWKDLLRGWAPQDDGGLAQVAERVLRGQVPHRDFDDPWTGGWSYFQAAVFQLFGTSLALVRWPIFVTWLTGLATAYRVMRRLAAPALSGGVALACALWSLFAWRFPLLSWFYFPLAIATCWCASRYVESQRRVWLVAAGFVIGMLMLVKITALFLLAGVLLWMLAVASEAGEEAPAGAWSFVVVVVGVLLTFLAGVFLVVRGLPIEMRGAASVHFLLPNALLAAWLVRNACKFQVPIGLGVRTLLGLVVPLMAGVALALLPYLSFFALENALPALYVGVLVKPGMRLASWALSPPGRLATATALLAPIVLFVGGRFARYERTRRELVLSVLCGAAMGALSLAGEATASAAALSIRSMPIVLPLAALWWEDLATETGASRSLVILLVAVAVTSQLAQVPWAAFNYFLYMAPLGVLATVALMHARTRMAPMAAFWTAMLLVSGMRPAMQPDLKLHTLPMRRGGLQVDLLDSVRYARMAQFSERQPAGPVFVLGDHPEIPFLLERPNAGRMVLDGLADSADLAPPRLLRMIDSAGVQAVVLAHRGGARGERDAPLIEALRTAFPCVTWIGRFEFRSLYRRGATPAARAPSCAVPPARSP